MPSTTTDPTKPAAPLSHDRVRRRTAEHVNHAIDRATAESIAHYLRTDDDAIVRRLEALEREWDVERVVSAHLAIAAPLVRWVARRGGALRMLPAVHQAFLLSHALLGWCPPTAVYRRLGFRSRAEIHAEREVLLGVVRRRRAATR